MAANKRPAKSNRDGEDCDFELENGMVEQRVQTLYEMLETVDTRITHHKSNMLLLKEEVSRLNEEVKWESAKTEPQYIELRQQFTDMKANYKKMLENMGEQIANANDANELLARQIVATELHKNQLIRSKKTAMLRLEREMETMALEFSEMLREAADRMSESTTISYSAWESDHGRTPLMKRLQDISSESVPS